VIDEHAPRRRAPAPPIPAAIAPPILAPIGPPPIPIAIAPIAIAPIPIAPPPRPVRDPVQTFVIETGHTPPQPIVAMPERPPPLLMDVTPHSLGVETAGGYCRRLILKNAPLPTEQTRTFTTAQDDQREVVVRICQGEDDVFMRNDVLGEVVLDQLAPRRRGELTIEVAFILDADGTLSVEARDAETGRGQRTSVNLRGGLATDEIEAMRARHERLG
jgi:molecular chaperone DnaK